MNKRIMIENTDELGRIKSLKKEIELLKELLVKKDIDALIQDSYLEVAAKDLGFKSAKELKKKLNIKQ